jgi:hypothetical protein
MVATVAVEREFRDVNRRTEVEAKWSDEGVERVAMLPISFSEKVPPVYIEGSFSQHSKMTSRCKTL